MENDFLTIDISPAGAELTHITDRATGYEFLWQADPKVWGRHAPVLFPIVGKVKDNTLRVNGISFPMGQHGFARDQVFTIIHESDTECWFQLQNNETTLSRFPFRFDLRLGYQLSGNTLHCLYKVINTGKHDMYFSIGAHPGFNLPSPHLNEYEIVFEQYEKTERHLLSDGLFNGKTKSVFSAQRIIPLSAKLFDDDAIVLKHLQSETVRLKHLHSSFEIRLAYKDFPFLGIWTQKNCERYICLEPWCGLADTIEGHQDISLKEGINKLKAGDLFERSYSLTFTS